MLSLDSPYWQELRHAYGAAGDVPEMLRLQDEIDENDLLFGYLCHQSTIYTATFAAVPHLFQMMLGLPENRASQLNIMLFLACVYAHDGIDDYETLPDTLLLDGLASTPNVPQEVAFSIQKEYFLLAREIQHTASTYWNLLSDNEDRDIILITLLATTAHCEAFARILLDFPEDEFVCDCPGCKSEIFVWADAERLVSYARDPVFNKGQKPFPVIAATMDATTWDGTFNRQQFPLWFNALSADYTGFQKRPAYFFGTIVCPHCQATFNLAHRLEEAYS